MPEWTLLVMAAGKGTRYGGLKQIEPLGPAGETIADYSVFDALRSGFQKIVFVIRRDIEGAFRDAVGRRIEQIAEVYYVFQDKAGPHGSPAMLRREKPWGTAHAVLSAIDIINDPFAVINADDHYGHGSFALLSDHFRSGTADAALVGFYLRNTLSDFGPVKRALCTVSGGVLKTVTELEGIEREGNEVKYLNGNEVEGRLTGCEVVSMNFWGFHPAILMDFRDSWLKFLRDCGRSEAAEFHIPGAMTDLISAGKVRCRVLQSPDSWFGITYREDRSAAMLRIQDLIDRGIYPEKLWHS